MKRISFYIIPLLCLICLWVPKQPRATVIGPTIGFGNISGAGGTVKATVATDTLKIVGITTNPTTKTITIAAGVTPAHFATYSTNRQAEINAKLTKSTFNTYTGAHKTFIGTVTSIATTSPITGGTITSTGTIGIPAATSIADGYLTSTDWSKFNGKQAAGAYLTGVTVDAPLTGAGTPASHIAIPAATASVNGYATSTQIAKLDGIATSATANAKISGTTLDSLTDDTGFVTAKAVQDGHNVPHAVPGTSGNLLQSNGTDWASVAVPTWNQNTSGTAAGLSGTPNITVGTIGATSVNFGGSTLSYYAEGSYTPTVTAGSGTFTSASATARYTRIGRQVTVIFRVSITTNGTAASSVNFTTPSGLTSSGLTSIGTAVEVNNTGVLSSVYLGGGSSVASINTYNNGYPGGSGYLIVGTITYFI